MTSGVGVLGTKCLISSVRETSRTKKRDMRQNPSPYKQSAIALASIEEEAGFGIAGVIENQQ